MYKSNMFNRRKAGIAFIALAVIGAGLYWRGPLVKAAMQLLRVSQGVIRARSSPKNGLVGYWNFDECDSCTTAADKSGSGNTGTFQADAIRTTGGKIGNGITLDGTGDYVLVGDSNSLDVTSAVTVSAWVNLNSLTCAGVNNVGVIAAKHNSATTKSGFVLFYDCASDGMYWQGGDGTTWASLNILSSKTFTQTGIWFHIAGTFDGATGYLYADGEQVGSDTSATFAANNVDLWIGGDVNTNNNFINAKLDDVRIYNRALSADEISRLYEEGSYRTTINANQNSSFNNGLVGMWSFNGPDVDWSQSASILDRSGTYATGTPTGAVNSRSMTPGIVGQAIALAGSSASCTTGCSGPYVALTTFGALKPSAFTISMWVRRDGLPKGNFPGIYTSPQTNADTGGFMMLNTISNNHNNKVYLYIYNGATWTTTLSTTALATSTWYHIAATYAGAGNPGNLYINGVNEASTADVDMSYGTTAQNAAIGQYDTYGNFPGAIDEVRLYNRALNAAEIQELYLSSARL